MYSKQNMKELRKIARAHGVKNINSYRRDDLVNILIKIDEGILSTDIRTANSNTMQIELDESLTSYKEVTDDELNTMQIKDSVLLEKIIREIIADNPDCDLDVLKLEKSLKELTFEKIISEKNNDLPRELSKLTMNSNVTSVNENKIDSKFDKINMYETRILELENELKRVENDSAKQKIQSVTSDKSRGEVFRRSSDITPDEYEFKLTIKNLEKKNDALVELLNSFQNEYFNAKKQIDVLESRLSERDEELNYCKNVTENKHMDFESNQLEKENEKLKIELEEENKAVILLNNKVENLNNDIKLVESNSKNNKELLQLNAELNLEKQYLVKKL